MVCKLCGVSDDKIYVRNSKNAYSINPDGNHVFLLLKKK